MESAACLDPLPRPEKTVVIPFCAGTCRRERFLDSFSSERSSGLDSDSDRRACLSLKPGDGEVDDELEGEEEGVRLKGEATGEVVEETPLDSPSSL